MKESAEQDLEDGRLDFRDADRQMKFHPAPLHHFQNRVQDLIQRECLLTAKIQGQTDCFGLSQRVYKRASDVLHRYWLKLCLSAPNDRNDRRPANDLCEQV